MKKIKRVLAVLSAITVIAATAMSSVTASEKELYEVPEFITSFDELKEYITEPVEISAVDWARLGERMTEEELYNYFITNNVGEEEAKTAVEIYYEGLKEIIDSGVTFIFNPKGQDPDTEPYNLIIPECLTDTSGTFESGVTYCFNEETKGLIFDGKGELSQEDFAKAFRSFPADFMFFGNDVTLECDRGARYVAFFSTLVQNWYNVVERPLIPTFTYEGSEYTKQFDECLKEINTNGANYKYYTVEDDTDPYTFANPLEPIPECHIKRGGLLWKDDLTGTSPVWSFDGTEQNGVLTIASIHGASYTLDDVLEIAKDYNPTEICLGSDMAVLPEELQGFDTIEEAEVYLLKLINDGDKTESVKTDVSNKAEVSVQEDETVASETAVQTETAAAETTLKGDADLSGTLGLADAIVVSKFNLNSKIYPLANITAMANADMNCDGVVDSVDCNMLIEANLGN